MTVAALVLAAGRGERLGAGVPKAFVPLAGTPLVLHALAALAACDEIDLLLPVVPPGERARFAACAGEGMAKLRPAIEGGARRQDSLRAGLLALGPEVELVAVHDAARPLVRPADVGRVVRAAREGGAAILAVPARDTIKRVQAGRVLDTPGREACWAAQTPQAVRRDWLEEALGKAEREGFLATDEAQLLERLGLPVRVIEGDPCNLKITFAADLLAAEAWWRARAEDA
jgi:2-C-methyl-D-erythritol 4-phosphate cytidylyltransferase